MTTPDHTIGGALTSQPLASGPLAASESIPADTTSGTIYAYATVIGSGFVLTGERRVIVPVENRTIIMTVE